MENTLLNAGGLLRDTVDAQLIVRGGAGSDTLELDDTGNTSVTFGTLVSGQVSGFGAKSYALGLLALLEHLRSHKSKKRARKSRKK